MYVFFQVNVAAQTREKATSILRDLSKGVGNAEQMAVELELCACDSILVQQLRAVATGMKEQYTVMHPMLGQRCTATPEQLQPFIDTGKAMLDWFKERKDYASAYLNVEKRKQKTGSALPVQ